MVSRHLQRCTLALLFLLSIAKVFAAEPIASIDRSVISIDDTLTLTIRVEDSLRASSPDTSPLERDFYLHGTSQNSRHTYSNGRSQSSTEWTITLTPKRQGTLEIPPLDVAGKKTQRLTVNVQPGVPHTADNGDPVYIESEVNHNNIYVQQQLIYTVRVFQSVQLDNMNLSDIEIDGALIEKLSQNTFQRNINNRPYRVHELRYAIFPQRSGSFTIPEVVFTANEIISRRSVFSLPGQGRLVRRMSKQHEITVQEPPASYIQQAGNPWLPAEDIRLQESWSASPDDIRVGDSITRSVTIRARGLLASQLPPLNFANIQGARTYPDQGQSDNALSEQGVNAFRTDSAAIIPTREGELEIPEITITWWDTDKEQLQKAIIPARSIEVKPALAGAHSNSTPLAIDHSVTADNSSQTQVSPAVSDSHNTLWKILAGLFAALWLLTLWLWWSTRRNDTASLPQSNAGDTDLDEKKQFKKLVGACRSNDLKTIRIALIKWAQYYWPDKPIRTLSDVAEHCGNATLATTLSHIDSVLYGERQPTERWSSEGLISLLKMVRANKQGTNRHIDEALPPLYSS